MRNYSTGNRTFNPLAEGSNPSRPTNNNRGFRYLSRRPLFCASLNPARFGLLCGQIAVSLLLIFSCIDVSHADEWTTEDTYREVTYLALHMADWSQSLDIADNPGKWHEHNPVLGSHPSRGKVNTWFAVTGLLHPVVSYVIPRPYREIWQYITIGVEIGCVGSNFNAGIGFGF